MTARASRWRRIGLSWLAMKTWVKVWLFFLNGVFLCAFLFLDDALGHWTLAAYLASGPLLLAMMLAHGGLTRLLGIAHLLPWIPLAAYVVLRLATDAAGPRIEATVEPSLFAYALLLLAVLLPCLALDAWDVQRWLAGQRFVLGSEEAWRRGASRRTLED